MSAGSEAIITAIRFRMIVGGYLSRKVHEEERACSHGGDSNQIYPGLYAAPAARYVVSPVEICSVRFTNIADWPMGVSDQPIGTPNTSRTPYSTIILL